MMSKSTACFKDTQTFECRKNEANRVRSKYPNRIPVIVERANNCNEIEIIDKRKYLVPTDLTMGQFIYVIRKRLKTLSPEKALFVFVANIMPPTGENMAVLYQNNKDEDGFLYITYSGENTFG